MGVAEPLRRPTASRGRKRPRAAARLVGTSRAACCRPRLRVNPFLVWFVFLWLLFSGVWETLIFGTGDWFAFGEPFFCGLFTPTNPLPGHRLVPESQFVCCLLVRVFEGALVRIGLKGSQMENHHCWRKPGVDCGGVGCCNALQTGHGRHVRRYGGRVGVLD